MLNAFRHHGVSRTESTGAKDFAKLCSTPFGITEFRGPYLFGFRQHRLDCAQRLSASRSFAECRVIDDPANEVVLNAFRHHGVSRVTISNLTAGGVACSTPFGITEFRGLTCLEMTARLASCSTPFGITEFRGCHDLQEPPHRRRCSTPFGITEFRGPELPEAPPPMPCAQRLSASRSFAEDQPQHQRRMCRVLNAFRHHGVSRFAPG